MRYSKLQYFFWLISGSEISILEHCENDYNRHANIGLMILITSLFAAFTSFVAGYTFSPDNLFAVSLFSLAWALLIFAIDRSMVNSIKRDPKLSVQPFWPYFIPRLILAFILAFFMSIPLDHIVFHERIQKQMIENNDSDWKKKKKEYNEGYNTAGTETDITRFEKEKDAIDKELKSDCPLSNYLDAKSNFDDLKPKVNTAEKNYKDKRTKAGNYYSTLQINTNTRRPKVDKTMSFLWRDRDNAKKEFDKLSKSLKEFKDSANAIDLKWRAEKEIAKAKKTEILTQTQDKLIADKKAIDTVTTAYKKEIENMKGFDTQFATLFLLPNWGVQILKWLIFLALFVIEILPTYLKLKTPIGQYDKKMQEKEDIMNNDIELNIASEKEIKEKSESHRVIEGIKLNTTIYDKIASIELKLAEETLDEWEKKAREQKNKTVDCTSNMNIE